MEHDSSFLDTEAREYGISDDFHAAEVGLANRNHGTALELMRHDITPTGMHYLLTHFDVPFADEQDWKLDIEGEVDRPVSLSMSQIRSMETIEMPVTLECAGNGRALCEKRNRSMPWHNEAVGTSTWIGTPLADVLETIGIRDTAVEIAFIGADRGFDKGHEHNFGRSLTVGQAANRDILLVHGMNGAPLLPQHGYPLRLIVPGWYGMASVKWLNRIEVLDRPYDGFQQIETYRYRKTREEPGDPVSAIRVKSLMIPPGIPDWYSRKRIVDAGTTTVLGRAWSGNGVAVEKVEFSHDGQAWHPARLHPRIGPYAWTQWEVDWNAVPGQYELSCRATDKQGNTQPLAPPWDVAGFGNNVIQKVPVIVR